MSQSRIYFPFRIALADNYIFYPLHAMGKKSAKFFYGFKKRNALCGAIKMLLDDGKEITSASEISLTLK